MLEMIKLEKLISKNVAFNHADFRASLFISHCFVLPRKDTKVKIQFFNHIIEETDQGFGHVI